MSADAASSSAVLTYIDEENGSVFAPPVPNQLDVVLHVAAFADGVFLAPGACPPRGARVSLRYSVDAFPEGEGRSDCLSVTSSR
jgi:hypothetical protein